jgi:hypothetical protein
MTTTFLGFPPAPGQHAVEDGISEGRPEGGPVLIPVTDEVTRQLEAMPDSKKWQKARRIRKGRIFSRGTAVGRRRDMPIRAYVGPNGSFKSATAILDLLPTLRGDIWECSEPDHVHTKMGITRGYRAVLSTVIITHPGTGEPHPLYRRLDDWRMVINAEHCELVFDEVTGIANSRDSMSLPRQVQVILDQLRKRDVTLSITAPSFQRMDSTLRTTCQGITDCRSYMSEPREKGVRVSAWRRKRLARVRTFSAVDMEEFKAGAGRHDRQKNYRLKPAIRQYWWGPGSEVFVSYSSKGAVARLGQASDAGLCLDCGGRRVAPKCTCDDH